MKLKRPYLPLGVNVSFFLSGRVFNYALRGRDISLIDYKVVINDHECSSLFFILDQVMLDRGVIINFNFFTHLIG